LAKTLCVWQKLAETCFCQTGLNRCSNRSWQKLANPDCGTWVVI